MAYSVKVFREGRRHLKIILEHYTLAQPQIRVSIYGTGDAAELAYFCLKELGLEPAVVFDGQRPGTFFGKRVLDVRDHSSVDYDIMIVAVMDHTSETVSTLIGHGVPMRAKILTLRPSEAGESRSGRSDMLNDQVVLITGGTGSFGKKFVDIVLKELRPRKLIVFSRDELKQYEMAQQFNPTTYPPSGISSVMFATGTVCTARLMAWTVVIHAAALKQVPTAEYNPLEAVKTNIMGAANVIDAAIDRQVKRVVALSTDKAANPVNLYGNEIVFGQAVRRGKRVIG